MSQPNNIVVLPLPAALALHVAGWLLAKAEAKKGIFSLSLAGGTTPKALYTLLAQEPFRSQFPWQRTHLFFGDERFVPHNHPDSNFNMVRETLLNHIAIPPENVHAIPVTGTPQKSAISYVETLQKFYGSDHLDPAKPLFDVTLLGIGEDGHTASLFPGTAALNEHKAWATAVIGAKPEPRLTLTYPVLENSATVAFLVAGAAKREILPRIWSGESALPAAQLKPLHETIWFLDEAAKG